MRVRRPFTFGYKSKGACIIRDLAALALGILFVFFPDTFLTGALVKILGAILAVLGIIQLIAAVGAMSLVGMGFLTFLLDGIVVLFGISLIFSDFGIKALDLLAGIGLIWYAIADFISLWKVHQAMDEYEIRYEKKPESQPADDDSFRVSDDTLLNAREVDYKKDE